MAWLDCLLGIGTKIIGYITKLDHGLADHDGLIAQWNGIPILLYYYCACYSKLANLATTDIITKIKMHKSRM